MQKTPMMEPVSTFQQRPRAVLERLDEGPVIVTSRGRAAAYVVSVEEWDRTAAELEELRSERRFTQAEVTALLAAQRAKAAGGPRISHDKLKQLMIEKYGDDVFAN